MHTRARPFASTTWTASIVVHIVEGKRPPRPLAEQSPQLTDAVWQLIQLCWTQDYRKRRTCFAFIHSRTPLTKFVS